MNLTVTIQKVFRLIILNLTEKLSNLSFKFWGQDVVLAGASLSGNDIELQKSEKI